MLSGIFHFYSSSKTAFCEQTVDTRILGSVQGQLCLPMSHKKDARPIWVNKICFLIKSGIPSLKKMISKNVQEKIVDELYKMFCVIILTCLF